MRQVVIYLRRSDSPLVQENTWRCQIKRWWGKINEK
jgi:hypothetical protein